MQINYSQFWWSDVLILNSFNFSFQNVFFSFQDQIRKLQPFCSDFMFLLKRRTSWPVHFPSCLSSITRAKLQQIWRSRCRCENFLSHCNHFYDPTQITCLIKGELKRFFLSAQSFYRPQTRTSFKRQFSPKSPKVGQKSGQRVKNWPNKNQVASDLLRESTDSVIRAAEGIHQFCPPTYWGNPLADNFSIRPAEGIHRFCHRSYWGNPSILSSDLLRESTRVYILYRWLSFK